MTSATSFAEAPVAMSKNAIFMAAGEVDANSQTAIGVDEESFHHYCQSGHLEITDFNFTDPLGKVMRDNSGDRWWPPLASRYPHAESVLVDGIGTVVSVPIAARPSAMTRKAPRRSWN